MNTWIGKFSKIYSDEKLLLISIFLFSCFISVIFLSFFKNIGPAGHRIPGPDYQICYAPMAEHIISGKNIIVSEENTKENYVRCAPGYPILLIPFFLLSDILTLDRISVIIFFNVIFTALSSVVVFLIEEVIFKRKIALISSLLWITYPFNQWLIKNPNTEVPFILFFLLAIFFFVYYFERQSKKSFILLAGVFLGVASLVRPISLLVPLILIAWMFFFKNIPNKTKVILTGLVLAGNVLAIIPWESYVFFQTREFVPLSSVGPIAIKSGFSFGAEAGEEGDKFKSSEDVMHFMRDIAAAKMTDFSYKEVFSLLLQEAQKYPAAFLKLILIKMGRAWYATSEKWFEDKILLVQIPYLLLAVFGIITMIKRHREKIHQAMLFILIVGYFWLMTSLTFSIMRYMIPVMPFILLFAAILCSTMFDHLFKKMSHEQ